MNPGDGVLYYTNNGIDGYFGFYGTVSVIIDSPELSEAIWQSKKFRYIHICEETPQVVLKKESVFGYLGYKMNKVQGFMKVLLSRWKKATPVFGVMDELVRYLQEIDELENKTIEPVCTIIEEEIRHPNERLERVGLAYHQTRQRIENGKIIIEEQEPETPPAQIILPVNSSNLHSSGSNFMKLNLVREDMGRVGEEIVYQLEVNRLRREHREDLAQKVEIVSKKSNKYGYDILSYYLDGQEKYIEVKSTSRDKDSSFELTYRELEQMFMGEHYEIYRLYNLKLREQYIEYKYYILDASKRDKIKTRPLVYQVYYG